MVVDIDDVDLKLLVIGSLKNGIVGFRVAAGRRLRTIGLDGKLDESMGASQATPGCREWSTWHIGILERPANAFFQRDDQRIEAPR